MRLPRRAFFSACSGPHADTDRAAYARPVIGAVAIRVLGIGQVLLVIALGKVKLRGLHDLRADCPVAGLRELLLVGGERRLGDCLLLCRMPEDRRTVLTADV